ncbi:MAG: UDP-N-acetylmuramate dehydrogenase [Synergistaceae bacterium]|jgi:UDP-N-acetylmuramate dehydrogenase|nr:UDP-N-acetylmuramate dehydrogenase [Synergistaceae bacterium]
MLRLSAPEGAEGLIRRAAPLAELTTWGVGGTAGALLSPRGEDQLIFILKWLYSEGLRPYILGGGSNTLAADGEIDIPVILTRGMSSVKVERKNDAIYMTCGAGVELREIFARCSSEGWSGMEFAAGIPGTIGGALMGNAGTPGGDIASVVNSVRVVDSRGLVSDLGKSDVEWGYRRSSLSEGGPLFISLVVLKFSASTKEAVRAGAKLASEARKSQPLGARTAGCVFKNPLGDSAGRLLEMSGCKGLYVGGARVSPIHANFIENYEDSTAMDIAKLAVTCRRRVYEAFGVLLGYEIKSFGFPEGFLKD